MVSNLYALKQTNKTIYQMTDILKVFISSIFAICLKTAVLLGTFWIGFIQMDAVKAFLNITEMSTVHIWGLHFITGTIITLMYAKFFNKMLVGIKNNFLRAMTYGFLIAVCAQLFMILLINTGDFSSGILVENQSIFVMFFELALGYMIFGGTLGLFYGPHRNRSVA